MTRRSRRFVPALLAGALAVGGAPVPAGAQAQPAPAPAPAPAAASAASEGDGALEVVVTYKGKGEVSVKNEVSVFLFTDPNIGEGSTPVGVATIEENGGHAVFKGLPPVVYIAVVYDDAGTYERQGPPPPGTPVSLYGMATAGAAEGVKPGKGAKVTITFDDSNRM